MTPSTRRAFLQQSTLLGAAALAGPLGRSLALAADRPGSCLRFGLVTYQWGRDWDIPTLIANCSNQGGRVERRTTHAHHVSPRSARGTAGSEETLCRHPIKRAAWHQRVYHHTDPAALRKAIEATKAFVNSATTWAPRRQGQAHACQGVPRKRRSSRSQSAERGGRLGGRYGSRSAWRCTRVLAAADYETDIDIADHPKCHLLETHVGDLRAKGWGTPSTWKKRFGATAHVRVSIPAITFPETGLVFGRWTIALAPAGSRQGRPDRVQGLAEQAGLFREMVAKAPRRRKERRQNTLSTL